LVWEALKLAKKRGCRIFDFEGIYDERFPKAAASWKGFTKFKEGFGGEKIVYLENFTR
jgi:lipid II:glycine glycyltransferase (peptidoglycan interpeptide bridge formation enzyme)